MVLKLGTLLIIPGSYTMYSAVQDDRGAVHTCPVRKANTSP